MEKVNEETTLINHTLYELYDRMHNYVRPPGSTGIVRRKAHYGQKIRTHILLFLGQPSLDRR
ncbi:MAG TPA: hypothetical protein PKE49_13075 [Leptospiraceae bacterium]|nr:hypothetical protein [Leptospirales bacterium]HMU82228.1 hypothetical protein [Leptospiraceae bacterium]HMW59126.1 hypothetical protein [Leptospiraceae bacterium]HMX57451.1 hypothetical protein [Leptospiraceae bacterium]HMY46302.1 hypothetical protein [Leptospiraceae bacterium]